MSRGVRPSSFLLYLNTGDHYLNDGDLTFYDTGIGELVTFRDCVSDHSFMTPPHEPEGNWWVVARVFDRRKRWECQHAEGEYNVRNPAGEVELYSKKTCRALVILLLNEMGESSIDTSAVSTAFYPYLKYSGPPAYALQEVLDRCGYALVLKNDNTIEIVQLGNGLDFAVTSGYIDPPSGCYVEFPESIVVSGGPTVWQSLFSSESVGEDADGEVVAIDSLSYAPVAGFSGEIPQLFIGVAASERPWAFKTVHKWFRLTTLKTGGFTPTGASEAGTAIDQLLPLLCTQAECGADRTNLKHPAMPIFHGQFYPYSDHPYNTGIFREVSSSITVDRRNGIIKTDHPVYKLSSGCPIEADMYLLVAHRFRKANKEYDVWTRTYDSGGAGETVELSFPELFKSVQQQYNYTGSLASTSTNETDIQAEADAILASWYIALSQTTPSRKRFGIGIRAVECSGIVSEVEWSAGRNRIGSTHVYVGSPYSRRLISRDIDAPLKNSLSAEAVTR